MTQNLLIILENPILKISFIMKNRNVIAEARQEARKIIAQRKVISEYRKINMSKREIAIALGISETSPLLQDF